jgi:putative nucleotidyltransferase with HDIG domain
MDQEEAKQLIINKIENLPTIPDVVHKIVTLVQDERTAAKDLCKLISYDQSISLRLLKVANSAYYGFLREVATIQHAVVILGFDEVKRLSLGIAMFNFMQRIGGETSLVIDEFWKHSIGCSLAARIICEKVNVKPDIIATASLLHDVGKLALDNLFSKEYRIVLEKSKKEKVSSIEVEKEILGFGHADVGLWLCTKWKFPPSLILPIAHHHKVDEADQENILQVSVVHLADILSKKASIGNSGDTSIPCFQKIAEDTLRIKEKETDKLVKELQGEEEKVRAFIDSLH